MRPNATKADVPSSHDITTYIHNEFVSFIKQLKVEIQVSYSFTFFSMALTTSEQSPSTGRVSTTMDLWSVDQTKASFLGITAHWITIDESSAKWSLRSQVVAFRAFSGAHTGENIARYFVGLCERAGIITSPSSKLFCLTADNATSNDKAADIMERLFHRRNIYSFSADSNRLACLAHVINLAITSVLSAVTKISNVDTTTNIWEFDPTLPQNRMVNDSLDVITTIRTLAIKMQCSGQRIEYFETLQVKCGIDPPLSIPLHSNVRWGTADGMLGRAHELRQVCITHALTSSLTQQLLRRPTSFCRRTTRTFAQR